VDTPRKLSGEQNLALAAHMHVRPGITLAQFQAWLLAEHGIALSTGDIWNAARRLGGCRPKKPCARPIRTSPMSHPAQAVESGTASTSNRSPSGVAGAAPSTCDRVRRMTIRRCRADHRRLSAKPLDDCLYALPATIPHLTRSSLHVACNATISRACRRSKATSPSAASSVHALSATCTSKWQNSAFVELQENAKTATSRDFLLRLIEAVPTRSIPCSPTAASRSGRRAVAHRPPRRSGKPGQW